MQGLGQPGREKKVLNEVEMKPRENVKLSLGRISPVSLCYFGQPLKKSKKEKSDSFWLSARSPRVALNSGEAVQFSEF